MDDNYNIMGFEDQQLPDTLLPEKGDTELNVGETDDFVVSLDEKAGYLDFDEEIIEYSE